MIKFSTETESFKHNINIIAKTCGLKPILPITQLVGIKLNRGELTFYSTDMENIVEATITGVCDNTDVTLEFCVDANKFTNLVSKLTYPQTVLCFDDTNILTIKCGGQYKFPAISDNNGIVIFPYDTTKFTDTPEVEFTMDAVLSTIKVNTSSLAQTMEYSYLTKYYCSSNYVLSSNGQVITRNKINFSNMPILLTTKQLMLLKLFNSNIITLYRVEDKLRFCGDDVALICDFDSDIDNFPVEAMENYYKNSVYIGTCTVPKQLLLDILDRCGTMVEPFDSNAIRLTFKNDKVILENVNTSFSEPLLYVGKSNIFPDDDFVCHIDITALYANIKSLTGDEVTLYAFDNVLRVDCLDVSMIFSFLIMN